RAFRSRSTRCRPTSAQSPNASPAETRLRHRSSPMEREAALALDPLPASVPAARRFVGDTLERWACHDAVPVATLLVSEIITNAILHAGSNAYLRIRHAGDTIRVEVHDATRQLPTPRPPQGYAESGRGLLLVKALAFGWGVAEAGDGKVV